MDISLKSQIVFVIVTFSICGLFLAASAETITKPHTFINGTPALASEVNANFDVLFNQINDIGNIITVGVEDVVIGTKTTGSPATLKIISEEASASSMVSVYGGSAMDFVPAFFGNKARGTISSPNAVQSGDVLTHFGAKGYDGESWEGGTTAGISIVATETYSTSNRGSKIVFFNTPNNSSTRVTRAVINPNGNIGIGTTSPQSTLQVNGYTQLALTGGVSPPATDCDESSEYGRMKVDENNARLYICVTGGWVSK